jgi:hypothetical protein
MTFSTLAAIAPRRNIRLGIESQIAKIKSGEARVGNAQQRIAELEDQLQKTIREDEPQDREVEQLKRTGLKESEQAKWQAIRQVSLVQSCPEGMF